MPLSRCNILIVEDQAIIALDLQIAVEDANAQVIGPAASVREALDLLHTNAVDAAILDANLPDGDVTPVAEEMIERGIPFVINTGVAVPLQLRRFPNVPVFRKPTAPSRLIRELAARLCRFISSASCPGVFPRTCERWALLRFAERCTDS